MLSPSGHKSGAILPRETRAKDMVKCGEVADDEDGVLSREELPAELSEAVSCDCVCALELTFDCMLMGANGRSKQASSVCVLMYVCMYVYAVC